jgi:hypothetical protein
LRRLPASPASSCWLIGESPLARPSAADRRRLGSGEGIGFTLYYATNFIFTGLSVAVAFHAGLFNIGGEGQAYLGGIGWRSWRWLDSTLPWYVTLPLAIIGAAACSARSGRSFRLAAGQARQPHRHHHHHVQLHRRDADGLSAGQGAHRSRARWRRRRAPSSTAGSCRSSDGCWTMFGAEARPSAPLNVSFLLALVAAFVRLGADLAHQARLRDAHLGQARRRRAYAGIRETRIIIIAMLISGALAGMMALNPVMGDAAPAAARFRRRRRLRRHRGGADGPQPSGRHRARGDPVRHALSGRR